VIALLLLACTRHPPIVPTWPGLDGRTCTDQRVVLIDPDPWVGLERISIRLNPDERPASGGPHHPLAVLHADDLRAGLLLELDGDLGPASCRLVPGEALVEQRSCGEYSFSIHYAPLCDFPPEIEGLERTARPETANFALAQKFGTRLEQPDVRDAWNALPPFGLTRDLAACNTATARCDTLLSIQQQMDRGLARLDALDRFEDPKKTRDPTAVGAGLDWCEHALTPQGLICEGPHPLRDLLLDDFLLVDTSKRCTLQTRSFLEIEMAHIQGRAPDADGARHQTCGGRTPGDDVVDTLLTITINGPDRLPPGAPFYGPSDAEPDPPRGDGVNAPSEPAVEAFPWLGSPRHE